MTTVDIYNQLGRIPCSKCGLDLLENEYCKPICFETPCKGIVITKETLKNWAKQQGKTLPFNTKRNE